MITEKMFWHMRDLASEAIELADAYAGHGESDTVKSLSRRLDKQERQAWNLRAEATKSRSKHASRKT